MPATLALPIATRNQLTSNRLPPFFMRTIDTFVSLQSAFVHSKQRRT